MICTEVREVMLRGGDAAFIDVRSAEEYGRGHAKGFLNVPLDDIARNISCLPIEKTLYFICYSGGRSLLATKLAAERGLIAVNIEGGLSAWQKAGLPTE